MQREPSNVAGHDNAGAGSGRAGLTPCPVSSELASRGAADLANRVYRCDGPFVDHTSWGGGFGDRTATPLVDTPTSSSWTPLDRSGSRHRPRRRRDRHPLAWPRSMSAARGGAAGDRRLRITLTVAVEIRARIRDDADITNARWRNPRLVGGRYGEPRKDVRACDPSDADRV